VYPNPAREMFTIASENKFSGIEVRNLLGEIVFSRHALNVNTFRIGNRYPSGIYFVDIFTEGQRQTVKLVIE
jgi:hypothetical protein